MSTVANLRQDEDLRAVKHFLTNISNRRSERYYYPDGNPKYSVIQIDSIQAMDVLDRLVSHVETIEAERIVPKVKPKFEVRKHRFSLFPTNKWWVKRKVLADGIAVNYIPWWGRPIEFVSNILR